MDEPKYSRVRKKGNQHEPNYHCGGKSSTNRILATPAHPLPATVDIHSIDMDDMKNLLPSDGYYRNIGFQNNNIFAEKQILLQSQQQTKNLSTLI